MMDIKRNGAGHFWSPALRALKPKLSGVKHGQDAKHYEDDTASGANHYSGEMVSSLFSWKKQQRYFVTDCE